ncbi:MAG TPA: hypothetical protein VHW23_39815 [Kofleriaceae bacterium]|nr:hypothetical protein [Kofleriaceae bacterium]
MTRFFIAMVGGVMSLIAAGAAEAAPPAWCQGAQVPSVDLHGLSSKDVREVIKAFVAAECAPSAEADAQRAEIEAARQAWSRRLGMTEADWADAVAYAQTHDDHAIPAPLVARTLAAASPLDQYAVIYKGHESLSEFDTLYAADVFEPHLSEAGRLAFVQTTCFHSGQPAPVDAYGMTGTEAIWAICQADLDRIDVPRLFEEIRADAAHDGALKMKLRVAAYELPARIKSHAAEVQQMLQRDDASKKLFELAGGAREAWASGIGKNARLLELALAMDSAAITQSRKQLEGCGETTAAALGDAVSTIPASAFAGLHDVRDNPMGGFATAAGPVLASSQAVELAAIAFVRCTPDAELSGFLKEILAVGPPARGPRNTALARIEGAKVSYDKVGAKLVPPRPRPFGANYPDGMLQTRSAGGAVKAVKHTGDLLTVDVQQTLVKQMDCVRSHKTGRISKIHGDGRVDYEDVCDRSELRTHDHTWTAFQLSPKYAAWLKPGVVFSATGKDLIAVWPSASAKAPSMVLGGAVK